MNKRNKKDSSEDKGFNLCLTLSESAIKAVLALAGALLLGSGVFLDSSPVDLPSHDPLLENTDLSHE